MNTYQILEKYYDSKSEAYRILVQHSELVTKKAMKIGQELVDQGFQVDLEFIKEASMLHDIGIFLTNATRIDCHGSEAYIKHGILGRQILEKEGYPKHALVCERHVGIGISKKNIIKHNLPLPKRDMLPISLEEKIVCFADKFYSKDPDNLSKEATEKEILSELEALDPAYVQGFHNLKKELYR